MEPTHDKQTVLFLSCIVGLVCSFLLSEAQQSLNTSTLTLCEGDGRERVPYESGAASSLQELPPSLTDIHAVYPTRFREQ